MSTIIGLTEDKPIQKVWKDSYLWSFPYYMVGAAAAGLVNFLNRHIGWQSSLLVLPPIYLMYRSYRLYLGKLETEKNACGAGFEPAPADDRSSRARHRSQGRNHRRTSAAGARIRHGTGKGTGPERGREGSAARSFGAARHRKAGRARTHHFEARKTDAGRIREDEDSSHCRRGDSGAGSTFPIQWCRSCAPTTRNGTAADIRMGWRERRFRSERGFSLQSIAWMPWPRTGSTARRCRSMRRWQKSCADAGKSFDPKVVAILRRRYIELEKLANEQPLQAPPKLSTDIKVERGSAPAAGFAESAKPVETDQARCRIRRADFGGAATEPRRSSSSAVRSAASLRQRRYSFAACGAFETSRAARLDGGLLPEGRSLMPEFVSGENFRLFSSLRIPMGEGLSGWVAQNHKAILNGNPSVEPGIPERSHEVQHAAFGAGGADRGEIFGVVAVLALYRAGQDAFTADDLRTVEALNSGLGTAIETAQSPRAATAAAQSPLPPPSLWSECARFSHHEFVILSEAKDPCNLRQQQSAQVCRVSQ